MLFRTSCAVAALLIGTVGGAGQVFAQKSSTQRAVAQYQPPPPQAYPAPQGYPARQQLAPPVDPDEVQPFYDTPPVYARPLPPGTVVPVESLDPPQPPGPVYGRAAPLPPSDVLPPGHVMVQPSGAGPVYRDEIPPPGAGYDPRVQDPRMQDPRMQDPRMQEPRGYEPAASTSRPYYPGAQPAPGVAVAPEAQDGIRPPLSIGPGDQGPTGAVRDPRTQMAALPPDIRPETGPTKELPMQFRRTMVDYRTKEPVGTIIIDTQNTYLYLVLGNGKAMRYGVGVGREGFTWAGAEKVTRMAEWPDWNPPSEMIERQPYLPRFMAGGDGNPLGARALYLGKTIYRIHGTNQPSTIGSFVSSGCIRLTNEDVTDLYTRVKVGTRVVVLPGRPPAAAAATSLAPPGMASPPVSMAPPAPQRGQPPFVR